MSLTFRLPGVNKTGLLALVCGILLFGMPADGYEIMVWFDSTVCFSGQQNVSVPVYMANYKDVVVGYRFWFFLGQSDIGLLADNVDDLVDTTETLTSGWQFLDVISYGGVGMESRLSAISDLSSPYIHGIDFPQSGDKILVKIKVDIQDLSDLLTYETMNIMINTNNLTHFGFADPQGHSLGLIPVSMPDTSWFQCLQWQEPEHICLDWMEIPGPPADSVSIEYEDIYILDTTYVNVKSGKMTVLLCGDCTLDKTVNLLDIIYLIDYKFKEGTEPVHREAADVNHDKALNVLDIVYLVEFKFKNGPAPSCY